MFNFEFQSSINKIYNMQMVLFNAYKSENYKLYKKGLDELFKVIFEDI